MKNNVFGMDFHALVVPWCAFCDKIPPRHPWVSLWSPGMCHWNLGRCWSPWCLLLYSPYHPCGICTYHHELLIFYGKSAREIYRNRPMDGMASRKCWKSATDISGHWSGATKKLEESQNPTESHRDPWTLEGLGCRISRHLVLQSHASGDWFLQHQMGFMCWSYWFTCPPIMTMFEKDNCFICTWYHMIRSIAYSTPVESEDVQWVFLTFL